MRSSRWQAQGNVYLVAEEPLTADRVRDEVGDADGILEVRDLGEDWLQIAVWNPDGSIAEMSGNGTRIAARWLSERTGAQNVTVWVGPREVKARMIGDGLVEQSLGPVVVGEPEEVEGIRFTPVDVGNPHAVVRGRSCRARPHRPAARDPSSLSEPDERAGGKAARRAHHRGAGVGARRGGDRRLRHERDRDCRRARRRLRHRALSGRRSPRSGRGRARRSSPARQNESRCESYRGRGAAPSSTGNAPARVARARHGLGCSRRRLRTVEVPTGGFTIGLPTSWVNVTSAAPNVLKELEKVPAFKSFAQSASQNGSLKLIAADPTTNGSAYMDTGVARVGAGSSRHRRRGDREGAEADARAQGLGRPEEGAAPGRPRLRDPSRPEGLAERDRRVHLPARPGRVRDRLRGDGQELVEVRAALHEERAVLPHHARPRSQPCRPLGRAGGARLQARAIPVRKQLHRPGDPRPLRRHLRQRDAPHRPTPGSLPAPREGRRRSPTRS